MQTFFYGDARDARCLPTKFEFDQFASANFLLERSTIVGLLSPLFRWRSK